MTVRIFRGQRCHERREVLEERCHERREVLEERGVMRGERY